MALMLLTFGLAGCGGDEPAAVVTPPAPPPAPPPFVPQAVEVALGTSGQTLTLMTTESGGYTFNGEAFATGTDISADNGSTYTLTLDGTTWSAAYKMPEAMSLALGISGENISIQRLEDGSYQFGDGMALTSGMVVTAGNGNMYTVTLGDDGGFAAEYVQPDADSIALGTSGSMIDVRRNEDGSYSYMDGGQWLVITADSRMSAANGNVYGPLLAPDGRTPVGVMHVAAMQDVTLGALGGTLQLTQAEDMSWQLGGMKIESGHVHAHANGNRYVLTLDAAGMWSAVYQQNMVTVALGTQGSVSLAQAEDMSWWLGTEGVQAGSEVMSDSGNTYTLRYADGAWTARFAPESTAIEGTGLTAMSKEDRSGYDVGGDSLPASGIGDVTVDGAMYHVWMADGGLAGSRFGQAYKSKTYRSATEDAIGINDEGLRRPVLSSDDPQTVANEQGTHLLMSGPPTTPTEMEEGRFSFADLLGRGMASDSGERFVAEAVETIERARAEIAALLAIEDSNINLTTVLSGRWDTVKGALDDIFNTDSQAADEGDRTSAVAMETPDEEDILAEIDDILAALGSEAAFVAATAKDGGGVFDNEHGQLAAKAASDAFKRVKWTATATMGATGSTRYGTVLRKQTADDLANGNAKSKLMTTDYGAFSYSTMSETARTADVVALTGIARYEGATEAISAGGTTYAGTMDVQVRFNSNTVSGAVHGLVDQDAEPWQHNAAGVETIILSDATLQRDGEWHSTGATTGSVFYTRDSGLLRPFTALVNSFSGRLLGRGSAAGSEANGVWRVGSGSNLLTGGFGVLRTGDITRQRPKLDDGDVAKAKLFTMPTNATAAPQVSIGDGKLTVKVRAFGWTASTDNTTPLLATFGALTDDKDTPGDPADDVPVRVTAAFELAELADESPGAETKISGPKHVDEVVKQLQASRDVLAALQALEDTDTDAAEIAAWQAVQRAVQYQLFGDNRPVRLSGVYNAKEALGLIDQVIDALSSQSKLLAALDPDGTGIFDHYHMDANNDGVVDNGEGEGDFIVYDSGQRRYETNGRTLSQFLGESEYTVVATLGTTAYTRFGVWSSERVSSARRLPSSANSNDNRQNGVGTFAYSQLDPTPAGPQSNPAFPVGGTASYEGETVARMGTNFLTGTARVDVNWAARSGSNALDFDLSDSTSNAGLMSLTVSGLEDKNGEPLRTNTGQVADIVFADLPIDVGLKGANSGQLIVGDQGTDDDDGNYTYGELEIAVRENLRYRFEDTRFPDATRGVAATAKSVKALFVGQGVDGPLGVIGTWTLQDASLGITNADGDRTSNDTAIYGSFGADLP